MSQHASIINISGGKLPSSNEPKKDGKKIVMEDKGKIVKKPVMVDLKQNKTFSEACKGMFGVKSSETTDNNLTDSASADVFSQENNFETVINNKRTRNRMSSTGSNSNSSGVKILNSGNTISSDSGRNSDVVSEDNEFVEASSQDLGQQNPWSVQYPAKLWDQGSKNNNYNVREAEKRVMRLADFTTHTLSCVYSGFSNINPNDFVDNCHRSLACTEYCDEEGVLQYFQPGFYENGAFTVSSANSSNVAVLTAKNEYFYNKLLALGQVPYLKFNKFTREQRDAGILRIKSIKSPIITIGITGGEPENVEIIEHALVKEYERLGGPGTIVRPSMGVRYVEFFRGGKLCRDKVYSGEIRLTITLPPGVDKELPTGPVDIDLGLKGRRQLYAYQYGNKSDCKQCGSNSCFKGIVKRCVNRCKYCGLSFSGNHCEETCPKRLDEAIVEQKWLVSKLEEDMVREKMPVIDLSAEPIKIKQDMDARKSSSWRERIVNDVNKVMKKVVDESNFGVEHDLNPYSDEVTRQKYLTKSAKRRLRQNTRKEKTGQVESLIKERLIAKVGTVLEERERSSDREGEDGGIHDVQTQVSVVEVVKGNDDKVEAMEVVGEAKDEGERKGEEQDEKVKEQVGGKGGGPDLDVEVEPGKDGHVPHGVSLSGGGGD